MPVTADLDKLLDKAYENKTLSEVLAAPVAGLAGITDAHAEHLASLKITTIGDLGRNKYFRWAASLADLQDSGAK
ncbi:MULTISPECIES: hypothetical protein [Embleya]|uniref:Uncharacterized protein n=2 Tax=Embleya TaxID=2699295 RepID=A0A1T3NSR6_9ACTN|nr:MULTISPECIES: hypothetical protein [Embleya]OPC79869.1 hypothetical protein B4N89_01960 [Embleya scabrispora]WSY42812.1 hypothetical protein OG948_31250 [Embleya sp. NBC_00888]GCD98117.1 hypothetical protein EHYA_05817 [Embleya hyalina]